MLYWQFLFVTVHIGRAPDVFLHWAQKSTGLFSPVPAVGMIVT